jgi:hypothetical protein
MARKGLNHLLIGAYVRTTKAINWHELTIPKDALGSITSVGQGGKSVVVKFHKKYGSFECWADELRPA